MFKDDDKIIWNPEFKDIPNNILRNKFYTVYTTIDIEGGAPYKGIYDECKTKIKDMDKFIHRDEFIKLKYGFYVGQEIYFKWEKYGFYERDTIESFTAMGVDDDMIICWCMNNKSPMLYLSDLLSIEDYRNKIVKKILL